jgi:versiconal hemiacetal acetate esterase
VYENASELGGNRNKILIAGTSSGAGLALAVTRVTVLGQARIPKDAIKGTVALGPVTLHPDNVPSNLADRYLSRVEYGSNVPVIDKNVIDECFASAGLQADDQYFVGSDQSNHRLFPPTYIATCEIDPLRDDGITLAESLKASGVSVQHDHYNGLPHCFWLFPSLPETPVFMKNLFLGVTRLLGSR